MKSAVTISLVPEARGGPFVFWDDLPAACRTAAELGFDALEVFPPSAKAVRESRLGTVLAEHGLKLAALGTGAGWLKHQFSVTSADNDCRKHAIEFIRDMIDAAGELGGPAIVGSMQGRSGSLPLLRDALEILGEHASGYGVPLIYEPLNRYETNLVNTVGAGVELLGSLSTTNVRLLADLFHMNIEEADLPAAIRAGARHVGHVHLADSNRRPAGNGHTDFEKVADALRATGYNQCVSAEALPFPDCHAAAVATINVFRRYFRS